MSHENHNNLQAWKNSLEELENLRENEFDKTVAWEKLYGRLNEKESGKKAGWYWTAAACLVLALIVSMVFINKTPDKITTSEIKPLSGESGNSVTKTTEKKDEGNKTDATILQKKSNSFDKNPNTKTDNKIVRVKPFSKPDITQTVSEQNLTLKPGNDFINPVNASSDLVITKPGKNKLRVVHVNELGGPAEEATGIERNVSTHYFQIKFANQEVYANHPVSNQKAITILKINTPVN